MDKKLIKKASRLVNYHENKMHRWTGSIASELQPYFKHEITAVYQPADGICILYDHEDRELSPANIGLKEVLEELENDENFYL